MKKYLITIFITLLMIAGCAGFQVKETPDHQKMNIETLLEILEESGGAKARAFDGLTTEGAKNLDDVDGDDITDGDVAWVIPNSGTYEGALLLYRFDTKGSCPSNDLPFLVTPTSCSGDTNQGSWIIADEFYIKGEIYGNVSASVTKTSSVTLTVLEMNTFVYVNGAYTITLPEVVASAPTSTQVTPGASVCVGSVATNTIRVNPNDNDGIRLNMGTRSTNGVDIYSAGATGDFICLEADSASGWTTWGRSGTWTEGT